MWRRQWRTAETHRTRLLTPLLSLKKLYLAHLSHIKKTKFPTSPRAVLASSCHAAVHPPHSNAPLPLPPPPTLPLSRVVAHSTAPPSPPCLRPPQRGGILHQGTLPAIPPTTITARPHHQRLALRLQAPCACSATAAAPPSPVHHGVLRHLPCPG
jgi:hypothetical protein